MSKQTDAAKVEAAFNKFADAMGADPSSITMVIEESLGEKRVQYSDVAESAQDNKTRADSEADDESDEADDESAQNNTRADSEDDDGPEIHFSEMDYTDIQKLASEKLDEYPEDRSRNGLVEALEDADISSADDTTKGDENDEDAPLHPDEAENPTKENYVFHFGICDSEDCSYGTADEESDYCASCKKKHDDSKSQTSSSSPKEDRNLSDLSDAEKNLVSTLIEDEGKSLEEAISMV